MSNTSPSLDQLHRALGIAEQIQRLQAELASLFSETAPAFTALTPAPLKPAKKGKPTMSAGGREKIAAAARARWARLRDEKTATIVMSSAAKTVVKKGGLTPEGRASLAAKMKARWAARKAGVPASNTPVQAAAVAKPWKTAKQKTTAKAKPWYAR